MPSPPAEALAAVGAVTIGDVPITAALLTARALPSLLTGKLRLPPRARPLYELLVTTPGFLELPLPGMLAGGYAGQPWRLTAEPAGITDPDQFARFGEPGYAKVTMHFAAEPSPTGSRGRSRGRSRVVTETRIHLTDEASRRAFSRYWAVVRPGSNFIRREWLRAARRRTERQG
jgi:hypothetical protein